MSASTPQRISEQELSALNDALEAAGIFLSLDQRDGALILSGEVDSAEMHDAALDLARAVAEPRGVRLEDAIDVMEIDVVTAPPMSEEASEADNVPADPGTVTDVGTIDAWQAPEDGVIYFPPTDPVFAQRDAGEYEPDVIGGFQPTSDDDNTDETTRQFRGDDDITRDVVRELKEDGSTTDLVIGVRTDNGVVTLIGEVASQEDADNAEAVAGRVDGVDEVRDEMTVIGPVAERRQ